MYAVFHQKWITPTYLHSMQITVGMTLAWANHIATAMNSADGEDQYVVCRIEE